jgi:polysaccharide biosynthesis transport protein
MRRSSSHGWSVSWNRLKINLSEISIFLVAKHCSAEINSYKYKSAINKLNPEIDELSKNLMNVKIVENSLNRDYTKAVEIYNNISEKFKEIDLVYQSKSDILEIKKLAYKPGVPIKPNKKLNIAIGGVLGLFMGIFIAFFLEFWQSGKK